jgi:oligopeptide/dipeptide ABC transporter ATP-binding protein
MTVGTIVAEPLIIHGDLRGADRDERVAQLLQKVGLSPDYRKRYPHEFSGGQRQRIGVARALATNPKFLVLDEPVSALDKSVQAQVLNLLQDLKAELALTYVFISHDLNVIEYIADRVLVMYLGHVVETGSAAALAEAPKHPYTRALFASAPSMDPSQRLVEPPISGDPPSPVNPPSGCRFRTRCAHAMPRCAEAVPPLIRLAADHQVACYLYDGQRGSA